MEKNKVQSLYVVTLVDNGRILLHKFRGLIPYHSGQHRTAVFPFLYDEIVVSVYGSAGPIEIMSFGYVQTASSQFLPPLFFLIHSVSSLLKPRWGIIVALSGAW